MNKVPHSFYTIRFNDCDPLGHLNNARYIDYFLNAREDHLRDTYQIDLKLYDEQGLAWVANSHEIVYLRPANYKERVLIQTALLHIGQDNLHLECLMTDEFRRNLKAIMRTRLIAVNPQTLQRTSHSEEFLVWARSARNDELDAFQTLPERIAHWKRNNKSLT